jgi:hypothetical protein
MLLVQVDEATAAQRRIPIHLVDATDGITPETGEAAGQPQVSKVGDTTPAWTNTTATLTAIGNGAYYLELTAGEVDTIGVGMLRYKSAATAEFQIAFQVASFDPYSATNLGLTNLDATVSSRSSHGDPDPSGYLDVSVASRATPAQVNTEVDNALNTAIPGSPTANSINEFIKKLSGAALAGTETAGSLFRLFYDIVRPVGQRTNNNDLDSMFGVPDTASLTMLTELQQYMVIIGVAQSGTVWYFRAHLELNGQVITSGCTNGTLDAYDENSAQIGIQQTDAAPDAQHSFVFSITDTPTADRPHYVDAGIDFGGTTYATRLQLATAD